VKLVLKHRRAPGDIIAMTGVVRDLALARPDVEIGVMTTYSALWENNPHIRLHNTGSGFPKESRVVQLEYGEGIKAQRNEVVHFMPWFHRDLQKRTGLVAPVTQPYPDLHLSAYEKTRIFSGRYWIMISGGKADMPAKVWRIDRFQRVVDMLAERGINVVHIGTDAKNNWHPELRGVINLVNKTTLRDVLRLLHGADGAICGVTMLMHAAAALQKPCVCLAGGREAWWWEAYIRENSGLVCPEKIQVPHRFLHTIGQLDCCEHHGCWRSKVVGDDPSQNCVYPIRQGEETVPKCLDMISPEMVVDAVMSYYTDGTLQAIDKAEPLFQIDRTSLDHKNDGTVRRSLTKKPAPASQFQLRVIGQPVDHSIFDHPKIGGRFTIFGLLYGDYPEMHRRFLHAITSTVPRDRMDLRIGSNELGPESLKLVEELVSQNLIRKHYQHVENAKKYPVMREMFYDPELPIETPYLIWMDDDTFCDRDARWMQILAQKIVATNADMLGPVKHYRLTPGQKAWAAGGSWYTGRPWQDSFGRTQASGDRVHFPVGAFWAIRTSAMRQANIPDLRLGHNGGDVMNGAAVYQQGLKIQQFSLRKDVIEWSAVPRRGLSEKHPGLTS